jgi:hypothetical protein
MIIDLIVIYTMKYWNRYCLIILWGRIIQCKECVCVKEKDTKNGNGSEGEKNTVGK